MFAGSGLEWFGRKFSWFLFSLRVTADVEESVPKDPMHYRQTTAIKASLTYRSLSFAFSARPDFMLWWLERSCRRAEGTLLLTLLCKEIKFWNNCLTVKLLLDRRGHFTSGKIQENKNPRAASVIKETYNAYEKGLDLPPCWIMMLKRILSGFKKI